MQQQHTEENPLQVAMVRLRLENVPFRMLHRGDFKAWPFAEDRVVVLVRTTLDPIPNLQGMATPGMMMATSGPVYMMSDGVERTLTNVHEFAPFHSIAMAVAGIWMSSGWNG
jgi:hypothetical protein